MLKFRGRVAITGVNPYLTPPPRVLEVLFRAAGRDRGAIRVRGRLKGAPFRQTLVRYSGAWRLYLNTAMRVAARVEVGDEARIDIEFDPRPRRVAMPPKLRAALARDAGAHAAFAALPPSRRREIQRYIGSLKRPAKVDANVDRVLRHLRGRGPKELSALIRKTPAGRTARKKAAGVD